MQERVIDTVKDLKPGDAIAFAWSYYPDETKSIEVAHISFCSHNNEEFIVHFLYGYKSIAESIKAEDVIGYYTQGGTDRIALWRSIKNGFGWKVVLPEHPDFLAWQERFKDRL